MSLTSQALRLCVQAISEPGQVSKDGERVLFFMGLWEYLINITQKLRYCLFCLVTVFLIMVSEHGAKGNFSKRLLGVCFGWTCINCIWTIWNLKCRGFSAYGWLAKPPLMGKHLEHIADFCNVAPRLKIVSDSFSPSLKAAAKKRGHGCPLPPPSAECCLPAFPSVGWGLCFSAATYLFPAGCRQSLLGKGV